MKPNEKAIKQRMMQIIENEALDISMETLEKLIQSSGGSDLRQIINILQMWKNQHSNFGKEFLQGISKDERVMTNNFEAANKLLNGGIEPLDIKYPTFRQKLDLFFIDFDFIPLLVQESYLNSMGDRDSLEDLETMAEASDMISFSDQLNVQIRQDQNWALLPNFGTFSSVAPCMLIKGKCYFPPFP